MSLTDYQAQRLVRLYESAEKEILKSINKALLKGNSTRNLDTMLAQVRAIRKDLLNGARTWSTQAISGAYLEGIKDTGLSGSIGAIHQQAMQVLADNTYQRLADVDQVIGRRVDDIYRNLAMENIRGTVAGVNTWKQTAQNYKNQLADQGITGFKDAAGRQWDMTTYSEMVAKTSTKEAQREGTGNRLLEHDIDLVEVTGGESERTCEACANWVGEILSLTGKTEGYTTLQEAKDDGLFHPNCTHGIVAANVPAGGA